MPGMEQEHLFSFELPRIELFLVLPSMPYRHYRLERFVVECLGENARLVKGQGQHYDVQFPILQHRGQIGGQTFFDFERHGRCALAQSRDQIRQDVGSDSGDHAEP